VKQFSDRDLRWLASLAKLMASSNPHEADTARIKAEAILAKYGLTLDDLRDTNAGLKDALRPEALKSPNVLELVEKVLKRYIWATAEELFAVALWVLHTFMFENFRVTPRLLIISPFFGCGKTNLLILLERLTANGIRFTRATPAGMTRLIDSSKTEPHTLIIDEGNLQIMLSAYQLRTVLNSNTYGDQSLIAESSKKNPHGYRTFQYFAPIAIAMRGLPLNDLMQRSIVIHIHRTPEQDAKEIKPADLKDPEFLADLDDVHDQIVYWARTCNLDIHPEIPVVNRYADNLVSLVSIADNLGQGERARDLARKLCEGMPDADYKLDLLLDIRTIFDELKVDRLWISELIEQLLRREEWNEWTGDTGDKAPRAFRSKDLRWILLTHFQIKPRTIYKLGSREERGPSADGYLRSDFEKTWRSYCK
jgi:hypothetical protein